MAIYAQSVSNNTKALHIAINTSCLFVLFDEFCKGSNIKEEVINRCKVDEEEYIAIIRAEKTRQISISYKRMKEILDNTVNALVDVGSNLKNQKELKKLKKKDINIEINQ